MICAWVAAGAGVCANAEVAAVAPNRAATEANIEVIALFIAGYAGFARSVGSVRDSRAL